MKGSLSRPQYLLLLLVAASPHFLAAWVPATRAAALRLDVDQCQIDVSVKATADSFVAHLTNYQVQIDLDATGLTPTKAVLSWDFADLDTGKRKRDKAMLKWLEHARIPKARFTMTSWETRQGQTWATGDMDLHGVTRRLSFPVAISRQQEAILVQGDARIDYREYGLKVISMMLFMKVDPVVTISFTLHGGMEPASNELPARAPH